MELTQGRFTPIKQQKVYSQIVSQFLDLIEQGEFMPGMRLPSERDLACQLNVSRVSLREALIILKIKGVVETVSGQGTFICNKPRTILQNYSPDAGESPFIILQSRKVIEPAIAGLAASDRTEDSLRNLEDILKWIESYYSKVHVLSDIYSEGDRKFHLEIARATQNSILIRCQEMIFSLMSQELWLAMIGHTTFSTPGRWQEALIEHQKIFEAIKSRDSLAATRRVRNHLRQVEKAMKKGDLLSNIDEQGPGILNESG
jgi:DNA-binding FadR family transcriptional regulator